ncbi:DNA polymerase III subunit delta [Mesorhizobium sp. LHD-90]|uniref:DNA polymerase III subunit delta n=1 Tax=Mesorhizobium sp. LHD-90 TaxID=3071414 RepID=UPI0027DFF291|nr:DNA polymerase III subunit delta [Mesorhizobium sp. LHD-90]MDQ6434157.1 DNA polymerase III subunit delta [Mesorhizobium sp. LHD-90]
MAQVKAHEVDGWLARPQPNTPVVLIYGPDRGLVSERARRFAEKAGVPLDDPFSVVKLDASDLDKEPGRLLDEANTLPMFAGKRLLWVRNAGGQKTLADDVKALCAAPPGDTTVLIEAGDLKKGVGLRAAVEAGKAAMALPCYNDDQRSVEAVIDDELRKAGASIEPEARALLRRNLGGDRMATRAEVAKLALYTLGRERITVDDVRALTGDVSAISVDEAVDAVLEGNLAAFDAAFARQALGASQAYAVLSALQRQVQALQLIRAAMERDGGNAASAVASARPPVFFSRRKLIEQALARWTSRSLARILERLQETVLQTRQRPDLAVASAHKALTEIAVSAARANGVR